MTIVVIGAWISITKKTKVMIFGKGSRLVAHKVFINNVEIECVRQYKYLGVLKRHL